jgi:lipid A disaccharide synthetase
LPGSRKSEIKYLARFEAAALVIIFSAIGGNTAIPCCHLIEAAAAVLAGDKACADPGRLISSCVGGMCDVTLIASGTATWKLRCSTYGHCVQHELVVLADHEAQTNCSQIGLPNICVASL